MDEAAEDVSRAAGELPNLPLEDALQLVHLYSERGSHKAEPAARRWLVRYLREVRRVFQDVAKGHRESCGGGNSRRLSPALGQRGASANHADAPHPMTQLQVAVIQETVSSRRRFLATRRSRHRETR